MSFQPIQTGKGVVKAVYGTTNGKGPASGISYDVEIYLANGETMNFYGIIPSVLRPSDLVDTIAARPNDLCDYLIQNGAASFDITEQIDLAACP